MPAIKSYALTSVRGLTAAEVAKLKKVGIDSTGELLEAASTRYAERKLARGAGLSLYRMREAVNRADLMRVSGLGPAGADLFENAGVNSVRELAQRNAKSLAATLARYVRAHPELNYRLPSPKTVASLVARANGLGAPEQTGPVQTLGEAKSRAQIAMSGYLEDVLFGSDPAGRTFRDAILSHRPSTEWQDVQRTMQTEIGHFLNNDLLGHGGRAGFEGQEDMGDRFVLYGRWFGLYTEATIDKATGKTSVYVEID